jgi:hypothetical protein
LILDSRSNPQSQKDLCLLLNRDSADPLSLHIHGPAVDGPAFIVTTDSPRKLSPPALWILSLAASSSIDNPPPYILNTSPSCTFSKADTFRYPTDTMITKAKGPLLSSEILKLFNFRKTMYT